MKQFVFAFVFYTIVFSGFTQVSNVDPTFGNSGIASAEFYGDWDQCESAFRYPDGRILVAGITRNEQNQRVICMVRFLASGLPDVSFGNLGKATYSPNAVDPMVKVIDPILQPDGKIILPGLLNVNNQTKQFLLRMASNGVVDNSFGVNGFYISTNPNSEEICQCRLLPDGRIWCLGGYEIDTQINGLLRYRMASIRFLANGYVDSSYNLGNHAIHQVVTGLGKDTPIAAWFMEDSTGFITGFYEPNQGTRRMLTLKIKFNGQFDSTFGTNGYATYLPPYNQFQPTRIKNAQNGGLLMTAQARSTGQIGNTAVYRFKANGRLDSAFGTNGIAVTPYPQGVSNNFIAVDFEEDMQGRIWVAHYGQTQSSGTRTFSVSRFLANGSIDLSYGVGGYLVTGLFGDPKRIFLSPDGYPIVAGTGQFNTLTNSNDLALVKVKPTSVSVNRLVDDLSQISLHPSVVSRGESVYVHLNSDQSVEWTIFHLSGKKIQEGKGAGIIETSALAPGMYLFAGHIGSNRKVIRFGVW